MKDGANFSRVGFILFMSYRLIIAKNKGHVNHKKICGLSAPIFFNWISEYAINFENINLLNCHSIAKVGFRMTMLLKKRRMCMSNSGFGKTGNTSLSSILRWRNT